MTLAIQAQEFLKKANTMDHKAFREAFLGLSDELKDAVTSVRAVQQRAARKKLIEEEGTLVEDSRKEILSPEGRYKLVVERYGFKKGWNYSRGALFRAGSDEPFDEVIRNYGSFPFLFIENHPNGHDYFIGGEDYQGQTVIELDTGKRVDYLPSASTLGFGFCWATMKYEAAQQLLVVDGCFWAAPYEYRFYDFSDPMNGWPLLEPKEGPNGDEDGYIDSDEGPPPEVNVDGTIRVFQTIEDDEDEGEDDSEDKRVLASIRTYRREGLKLVLQEEWVSDEEKARRIAQEEANRAYKQWLKDFKASDALYLACQEHLKDSLFSSSEHFSVGTTYDGWCPQFEGREKRICRRILSQKDPKVTLDLEWGAALAPIKLVIYKNGKHTEDKFFEHSTEGMAQAFACAKKVAHG